MIYVDLLYLGFDTRIPHNNMNCHPKRYALNILEIIISNHVWSFTLFHGYNVIKKNIYKLINIIISK